MTVLLSLLAFLQEKGVSSALIICALVFLAAFFILFYKLVYIKDQAEHRKNSMKLEKTLETHIADDAGRFDKLIVSVEKLTKSVDDTNMALVREHISKADISKEQWSLVLSRIEETAEVTFAGAFYDACTNCDCTNCIYLQEFSKLVQVRRKESWHIWEQSAVARSILAIIEQVDVEMYPKVVEQYIPDIISICHNKEYSGKFGKDMRLELLRSKIEVVKEKVKRDWQSAIMKRINICG